jgi:elongation factor Tu
MPTDPEFRMIVEDVFTIRGRGTIVTGRIGQGSLEAGNVVELRGTGFHQEVVVAAIEQFRRPVERASAGDYVGLVLEDIAKDEVERGDVLAGSKWDLSEAGEW